jgi:hypothetical protein
VFLNWIGIQDNTLASNNLSTPLFQSARSSGVTFQSAHPVHPAHHSDFVVGIQFST